jgi:hypothetical protein
VAAKQSYRELNRHHQASEDRFVKQQGTSRNLNKMVKRWHQVWACQDKITHPRPEVFGDDAVALVRARHPQTKNDVRDAQRTVIAAVESEAKSKLNHKAFGLGFQSEDLGQAGYYFQVEHLSSVLRKRRQGSAKLLELLLWCSVVLMFSKCDICAMELMDETQG